MTDAKNKNMKSCCLYFGRNRGNDGIELCSWLITFALIEPARTCKTPMRIYTGDGN